MQTIHGGDYLTVITGLVGFIISILGCFSSYVILSLKAKNAELAEVFREHRKEQIAEHANIYGRISELEKLIVEIEWIKKEHDRNHGG